MAKEQIYELMVIFDSRGDETEINREFDVVQSLIERHSTEFIGRADWGLKEFKYPIKKRSSGYYVYYLFKAKTDVPVELSHTLKMNEKVLRHMIIAGNSRSASYLDKLQSEPKPRAEYTKPPETTSEHIPSENKAEEPVEEEKPENVPEAVSEEPSESEGIEEPQERTDEKAEEFQEEELSDENNEKQREEEGVE